MSANRNVKKRVDIKNIIFLIVITLKIMMGK